MIKKLIGAIALSVLFGVQTNAASLSITGPTDATVGDSFQLQIWGDFFGVGLTAGGIDFLYDPALVQLDDIVFNLAVTPDFSCPGNPNCPGNIAGSAVIVWGEFLNDLISPTDEPPTLMATLDFTVVGAASEAIAAFEMVNNAIFGGWFEAGLVPTDTPAFNPFTMTVNSAVVPLPAAVWFMIGGLGTLLGFRRK